MKRRYLSPKEQQEFALALKQRDESLVMLGNRLAASTAKCDLMTKRLQEMEVEIRWLRQMAQSLAETARVRS